MFRWTVRIGVVAALISVIGALALPLVIGSRATVIVGLIAAQWSLGLWGLLAALLVFKLTGRRARQVEARRGFLPVLVSSQVSSLPIAAVPAHLIHCAPSDHAKYVGAMCVFAFLGFFGVLVCIGGYTGEYKHELKAEYWLWRLQKLPTSAASTSAVADNLRALLRDPDWECREDVASMLSTVGVPQTRPTP